MLRALSEGSSGATGDKEEGSASVICMAISSTSSSLSDDNGLIAERGDRLRAGIEGDMVMISDSGDDKGERGARSGDVGEDLGENGGDEGGKEEKGRSSGDEDDITPPSDVIGSDSRSAS